MSDFFQTQFLERYDIFVQQLGMIFSDNETKNILNQISGLSNNDKLLRGSKFVSLLNDEIFDLFLKSKIKVFSHKSPDTQIISESLFGSNLCLKNLLNNQPEEIKLIIWSNLHTLYMMGELLKPVQEQNSERIGHLSRLLYNNRTSQNNTEELQLNDSTLVVNEPGFIPNKKQHTNQLKEMLGVDVNNETTDMMEDIVKSFESVLSGNMSNPIAGIMEVSNKISVKYAEKINKGEIELDKLMQSISKKVPGMDKMMEGMMSKTENKPKEKILMDDNFSTANVKLGINKEEEKKGFDIGGILKTADQFGFIPGGKTGSLGGQTLNGIPNMGKAIELIQKIEKAQTREQAEELKKEMDQFLQKEMGVDVESLNAQLENVTQASGLKNQ
jgi:hypothetical protein